MPCRSRGTAPSVVGRPADRGLVQVLPARQLDRPAPGRRARVHCHRRPLVGRQGPVLGNQARRRGRAARTRRGVPGRVLVAVPPAAFGELRPDRDPAGEPGRLPDAEQCQAGLARRPGGAAWLAAGRHHLRAGYQASDRGDDSPDGRHRQAGLRRNRNPDFRPAARRRRIQRRP